MKPSRREMPYGSNRDPYGVDRDLSGSRPADSRVPLPFELHLDPGPPKLIDDPGPPGAPSINDDVPTSALEQAVRDLWLRIAQTWRRR